MLQISTFDAISYLPFFAGFLAAGFFTAFAIKSLAPFVLSA
jgi:hypothetical protein